MKKLAILVRLLGILWIIVLLWPVCTIFLIFSTIDLFGYGGDSKFEDRAIATFDILGWPYEWADKITKL